MGPKKKTRKLWAQRKRMRNFSVQVGNSRFKWPKKFPFTRKLPAILTWQEQPARGLEEAYDKSGKLDVNYANCLVCKGVAREPVAMPCCGHWLCSYCFLECAEKNPPFVTNRPVRPLRADKAGHFAMKCLNCQYLFCFYEVIPYETIRADRKAAYLTLKVECPNQCGLIGNPNQIVEHQTYFCSKRKFRCPKYLCAQPPNEVAKIREHFETCALKRFHCKTCGWPVPLIEKDKHNCIKKLTELITKIQYATNFDDFRTTRALKLCYRSKPFANTAADNIFLEADLVFYQLKSKVHQDISRVLFNRMNDHLPPDGPWLSVTGWPVAHGWPASQWH